MIIEDKVTLSRRRIEIITSLTGTLTHEARVRLQGELSILNTKIKALNTTQAAQLKATADQRRAAGLAEAQANAARARGRPGDTVLGNTTVPMGPRDEDDGEDDDPGQISMIDAWIDAVLLRHDVDFTRTLDGFSLDIPPKWATVIGVLIEGIYAASRGEELPELPSNPPGTPISRNPSKPDKPPKTPRTHPPKTKRR